MKLHQELVDILKKDDRLVVDGQLAKNKVIELALQLDVELLKLLLGSKSLTSTFFQKVGEMLVFDKIKFQSFVSNKQFLPDSFTEYKNKIGLTSDKNYLTDSQEVVLAFPYKDCVLEGGQTKEDAKRDEVFWNETLAIDEIDKLLEPKVLTNFKKYDSTGEHGVKEITADDNLIIKGNNLLALHSLKKTHKGKVKLIYIDPPYNTGDDDFNYNDNFSSSAWLTFIKNRLEIAKELLASDGLIFVQINTAKNNKNGQIGSPEFAYLAVLLDEIFNRKNFVANLHWKKKKQPSFLSKVAGVMESILVYAKDESKVSNLALGSTTDTTKRIDNASNNPSEKIIASGIRYMGAENFIIKKGKYQNKTMSTEFLEDVVVEKGRAKNSFRAIAKFRNTQAEITRFCSEDLLYITENNSFRRYKDEAEKNSSKTVTDLLLDWGQNQDATDELRKLFDIKDDTKIFDNPKPELLIHNIIACCTKENDLVLDFYLGSGTTCAVAHKLNRKYIGIEQMNYVLDLPIVRLKKVISGELGGVSDITEWEGGGSFVYAELAQANQVFVDKIQDAKNTKELIKVWKEMKDTAFLSYKVKPTDIDETVKEFEALAFVDQQRFLVSILDKNLLYVPYSEIDDKTYAISKEVKDLNRKFYGDK